MLPVNLMDAIADRLRVALKDYSAGKPPEDMPALYIGRKPLNVYPGQIPVPEDAGEGESFVYALVKKVEDEKELSMATVTIGCSVYDENTVDGWRNLYNIAEHIRQELLKNRILNKKFMLKLPLNTDYEEDQPFPNWIGIITAKYSIGQPVEEGIIYDNYQEIGFKRD